MEMKITEATETAVVIAFNGRLDMSGVNEIETQFKERVAISTNVIALLKDVPFLASLAMRMLMLAAKSLHKIDGKIVLVAPQESVESALRMSGLDSIMPIVFTEAEARQLLAADQKNG